MIEEDDGARLAGRARERAPHDTSAQDQRMVGIGVVELIRGADLGGRVPFEGEHGVVGIHTASVV